MEEQGSPAGSIVCTRYADRTYFRDAGRHGADGAFKADQFLRLFLPTARSLGLKVSSYIDVGCGSGAVVRAVAGALRAAQAEPIVVKAYDVSPHVEAIAAELRAVGIEALHGDFCASDERVDLVTLFDVLEHVPDPAEFLRLVSRRCRLLALHIPLDRNWNLALRDGFRRKIRDPGHLTFLDPVSALNLLASAGLEVLDYRYSPVYLAPSGRASLAAKAVVPLRWLLAKASPYLLARTLGGMSLMVLARTAAPTAGSGRR